MAGFEGLGLFFIQWVLGSVSVLAGTGFHLLKCVGNYKIFMGSMLCPLKSGFNFDTTL